MLRAVAGAELRELDVKIQRVVLDSTVFVAAALEPAGPSGRLLRRFLSDREFEAVVSERLLAEIEAAFADPRLGDKLGIESDRASRWVGAYGVLATAVEVPNRRGSRRASAAPWTTSLEALEAAGGGILATVDPAALVAADLGVGVEVLRPEALLDVLTAIADDDGEGSEIDPGSPNVRA
jgi:predicted nucleic acid-binding protein